MTFGAHKLDSEPFLNYLYELGHLLLALCSDMRRYRCTSTLLPLKYCSRIFSNPSAIYMKWCTQTFLQIFGLIAIFDHNFANIVVPLFRTYSRHTYYDLPQTLHGNRGRPDHQNRRQSLQFFLQGALKIWPN